MKQIAIYGAGGFGREVRMVVDILSKRHGDVSFAGFVDDHVKNEWMAAPGKFDDLVLAVADPKTRESMKMKVGQTYPFGSIIHPDVYVDQSNKIGRGCILCAGVMMTVDVTLESFVIVNLGCTIGHDVKIGSFSSIMPSVNISGSVTIGKNVFIGSGATILQGLTIGDNAVIGAGSVVIRSVASDQKMVGVPARAI